MIEIKNLRKSFGEKRVLDGLSLTIKEGEAYCVIGKSGCGKSVLLKHITGLMKPDSGEVIVDGEEVSRMSARSLAEFRSKIGYVFQSAALFDSYNVFENVALGLYERGRRDIKYLEREAKRVLISVGLLPDPELSGRAEFEKEWRILRKKKPADLSGGMKKRVGVARALTGEPKYVFYDEPTTGLDPVSSEQIDNLILSLVEKIKATSIIVTHDLFSVFKIAKKVAMLSDGKAVFEGSPEEFLKSSFPEIEEFLARYKFSLEEIGDGKV